MISRFGLRGVAVRAPFPLTVDLNLFQYAACSVGELAWTPYADLRNGSCSKRMLDLMNTFPHKPGFFVYKGYLYAWINRMLQAGREPHVAMHCALEPYTELELFRAYRVYYEQLQREIPAPCMGDIVWPDQCDPRFPLENDPRAAHYGMWGFCFSEAVTIFPLYFRITDSFNPISFANLLAFMKGNASKNPLKS